MTERIIWFIKICTFIFKTFSCFRCLKELSLFCL